MYRRYIPLLVLILVTACVPTLERTGIPSVKPAPTPTQPVCQPSPIQKHPDSFPEIQATMKSEGEAWALLFFDEAHANQDLKIVWRVKATGPGTDIQVQAHDEKGNIVQPIWGPEYHGGSTWQRPGLEWGTGFNLPKPGCWTITVTLGETIGEIYLNVLDS